MPASAEEDHITGFMYRPNAAAYRDRRQAGPTQPVRRFAYSAFDNSGLTRRQ